MKETVGFLKNIDGKFFALDENGNLREVEAGDMIVDGEVIIDSSGMVIYDAVDSIDNNFKEYLDDIVCPVIGHLKELNIKCFAQGKCGVKRPISPGDAIREGEIVVDDKGERVVDPFVVARIDSTIYTSGATTNIEAPLSSEVIEIGESSRVLDNSFLGSFIFRDTDIKLEKLSNIIFPSSVVDNPSIVSVNSIPLTISTTTDSYHIVSTPNNSRTHHSNDEDSSKVDIPYNQRGDDLEIPTKELHYSDSVDIVKIPSNDRPIYYSGEEIIVDTVIPNGYSVPDNGTTAIGIPNDNKPSNSGDSVVDTPNGDGSTSTGGGISGGGSGGSSGGGVVVDHTTYGVITSSNKIIEGELSGDFTVELLDANGDSVVVSKDIEVLVTLSNDNSSAEDGDYDSSDKVLTIAQGDSSITFNIQTFEDIDLDNEIFHLKIESISNGGEFISLDIDKFGEVDATIVDDDTPNAPIIEPRINYSYISEEGLDGGIMDNHGEIDTTNSTTNSGHFSVQDPNPTDTLSISLIAPSYSSSVYYSSDGEEINWTLSNSGHTLIGATTTGINSGEVLRIDIDDNGDYTTTLSKAILHETPISGEVEDTLEIPIGVRVTDNTGRYDEAILDIIVEDDAPLTANGVTVLNIDIETMETNISFIIDISSSMSDEDLADTRSAINAVIDEYSSMGGVNVNIVEFYANGNHQSGWIDADSAKALVLDNDKDGTDIENGLRAMVENSYSGNQPKATQDIMYFFGDGDTYDSVGNYFQTNFDAYTGIDADDRTLMGDPITDVDYDNLWTNFVTGGEIDKLYTYSVNTNEMLVDIAHIADNGENIISQDAVNLSDIADLEDAILSTVELYKDGTFANDGNGNQLIRFGADGGHLDEVSLDGVVVKYDRDNPQQTLIGQHGSFVIDFNTGTYRYIVSDTTAGAHIEHITAKIVDSDGDEADTMVIDVNIAYNERFSNAPIITEGDNSVVEDISQVIASVDDLDGTIDSSVMGATHGSVSLGANGDIIYTPYSGFRGSDIVSVLVIDNDGNTSTRNIGVSIIDEADNADTPSLTMSIDNGHMIANSSIDVIDEFTGSLDGWSGVGVSEVGGSLHIEQFYHTASKSFDFGSDSANKEVTITYNTDIDVDNWDDGEDAMRVNINSNNNRYNQTQESQLDGGFTHTITTNLDKDGLLEVEIFNESDSTNPEWLEVDNFRIEGGASYEYEVILNASRGDVGETLTNLTINDIPKGAMLKDSSGDIIDAQDDGSYIVDANPIDNSNTKVYIITDAQMSVEQNSAIKATVTSVEDSGDSSTVEVSDGSIPQIIDGVVEGLAYETSSGFSGVTDENGNFSHLEGDSVTFKVGDITLGEMDMESIDDDKVFLQDLADVDRDNSDDEYVENMAVLLQSLDSDESDNILITQETQDKFDEDIDLITISSEDLAEIIEDKGEEVVSVDNAMEHVADMMEEYNGLEDSEEDIEESEADEEEDFTETLTIDDIIDIDDEVVFVETVEVDDNSSVAPSEEYFSSDDTTVAVVVDDMSSLAVI